MRRSTAISIQHNKVTDIVTRDAKGFRPSSIPAFNYREAITMVELVKG
jgi:hypothetical protein